VAVHPPTIALVTNGPDLFDNTYVRYLTKTLRDSGPFSEVPLKMVLRAKGEGGGGLGGNVTADAVLEEEVAAFQAEEAGLAMPPEAMPTLEDATDELPALAMEEPIDELEPQAIEEPAHSAPHPAPRPRRRKPEGKKKRGPGVWDL
jgi:GTP-binding protein